MDWCITESADERNLSMAKEIGSIQMRMVSRGRDQQELRGQIEKLESDLGISPGGDIEKK